MNLAAFEPYLPRARLLYAVESGSRMWNAAAADSDYDVRVIYARGLEWHLRLKGGRDCFEVKGADQNLDIAGWEVKKALCLAQRSNPGLLEWLASPVVYFEDQTWVGRLRQVMRDFSPRAVMHHYTSLAVRQHEAYWRRGEDIKLKKYVYAARPLACVLWMREHNYEMPPMDWPRLMHETPDMTDPMLSEVEEIRRRRREEGDAALGRMPALDGFIEKWTAEGHILANRAPEREPDAADLDALFREAIELRGRTTMTEAAWQTTRKTTPPNANCFWRKPKAWKRISERSSPRCCAASRMITKRTRPAIASSAADGATSSRCSSSATAGRSVAR